MKTHTLSLSRSLPQSEDTQALGAELALLAPEQLVIFLKGPLGAGKTTFARGFIQRLGDIKRVKSPTYTLVETYTVTARHILHFDLYRLKDPLELEEIGIRDYTLSPSIWLVEWPERAIQNGKSSVLPKPDIILSFSLLPDHHALEIKASTQAGYQVLSTLSFDT